jgi:hypothetical protein
MRHEVTFRLTDQELWRLTDQADSYGLTVDEYAKHLALTKGIRKQASHMYKRVSELEVARLRELNYSWIEIATRLQISPATLLKKRKEWANNE